MEVITTHTYYQVSTDQHCEYVESLKVAKQIATKWKDEGDSHVRLFKTIKKEEGDTIFLDKKSIPINGKIEF